MYLKRAYFCFLVVYLSISLGVCAQNQIEFERLNEGDIATQSITYAIKQDNAGNIWMATEEGVIKYGASFSYTYNIQRGLPKEVNNRVHTVFIDSKNRVWIGTDLGVCIFDEALNTFKYVSPKDILKPTIVKGFCEDNNGNIWIGAFNGLWCYNTNNKELTNATKEINSGTINIQALISGANNKILIGTPEGLLTYNLQTQSLTPQTSKEFNVFSIIRDKSNYLIGTKSKGIYKLDNQFKTISNIALPTKTFKNYPIRAIEKDANSNFYIATDGAGIYHLNSNYKLVNHFYHSEDNLNSLSSNGVYDILVDNENIIWVATYGGGINFSDKSKSVFKTIKHILNTDNSIKNSFTRAIEVDPYGHIWFGTKKGISVLNPKTNNWKHLNNIDDIVLALLHDGNYMWIGTFNNGVYKVNIKSFKVEKLNTDIKKVYSIYKDSKNNLWLGGIEEDLTKISPNKVVKKYPFRGVRSIIEFNNSILVGSRFGVSTINIETGELSKYKGLSVVEDSLNYSVVNALSVLTKNKLLVATNGAGLLIYNQNTDKVNILNSSSGLPSDIVQGVIPINNQEIWASTTKGLARINVTKLDTTIHVFDKTDGLASTEYNYGSYQKINKNLIAFGGVDGLSIFNPNNITNYSKKPNIEFNEFNIFNKVVKPEDNILSGHINTVKNIKLKYSQNSITFKYSGILHNSASKLKYSWKFDGFSDKWTTPSKANIANFTNLNYGDYVFRVKASNRYGEWGPERTINVTILKPWWATNLAFIIYVLIMLLTIYLIIHFTSVIVKKKNADNQIEFFNNITHEIKTPLTILISSLDNVTESMGTGEDSKKRIKTTVKRINSLFEQMLNFQRVTSNETLLVDVSKIDLEHHVKKRINNFKPLTKERNIEIILNNYWKEEFFYFDKESLDKILLNLISNAIKYSFENGKITVNLYRTYKEELKIEIIDEGLGIPKDQQKFILKRYYRARNAINSQRPGTGLGLMMVKKLLEKTGGTINFLSNENKGTTFTILLKNLKQEYDKENLLREHIVSHSNLETDDQSELDTFSDSKILIVEDNDELRNILVNTLGVYFQIFEASNGQEGVKMTSQIFPDLILTDLIMPEMDGMQMAKQLKDDINLNHIPVFMLTVLQNSEQKLESIETGISEYIEKPVDIKFLLAKMINTLKWQKKLRDKYIHDNDADNASLFRNKKDQEFLKNLEDCVLKNIENESFSVHDLSASFSMSRTSLYMKLKNLVDLSPQDFIIHTKLKHAKKLLIEGEHSIKEVAYRSGFSNPKYFSTSFKKFYQITPSGFLDSLKNQI